MPIGMPKDRLTLDDLRAAKQMLMENDIGVGWYSWRAGAVLNRGWFVAQG